MVTKALGLEHPLGPRFTAGMTPAIMAATVLAAGIGIWFLPSFYRMALWAAIALTCLALIPLLWREGYTWVLIWLAPVMAFEPIPTPAVRAGKYALVALAVAIALLKRRVEVRKASGFDRAPLVAAVLLLAWLWIRTFTGNSPSSGLSEALRLTAVGGLVYMWLSEPSRAGGRRRFYYLWILMGLYQVGACMVEAIAYGQLRSYGTFASPNALGIYLILTIAITLAAALRAPTRRSRVISWLALVPLAFGLYLTGARSAWLATAAAGLIMVIVTRRWRLLASGLAVLALLAGAYLTHPVFRFVVDSAVRLEGGLTHRPLLWEAADRAIAQAPWVGYGVNGAGEAMASQARYPTSVHRHVLARIMSVASPHNYYREILLIGGVVALALLLTMVMMLLWTGARAMRSRDRWRATYALALVATTVGILIHSYFERSVFLGSMSAALFYWFVVAQTLRHEDPPPVSAPA